MSKHLREEREGGLNPQMAGETAMNIYLDPGTGALSPDYKPGWVCIVGDTGISAPLVIHCALHRKYEAVGTTASLDTIDLGHTRAADLVRAALAATCATCREWRASVRTFQQTLRSLCSARTAAGIKADDRLLLPVRSYLALSQALNSPKPLPEALARLAGMTLPCDPPSIPLGVTAYLGPDGAVALRMSGDRAPNGARQVSHSSGWCLMRCATHGWEHIGSLMPPDGKTRLIVKELGHVLLAQGVQTCEEYAMTRRVMDAELGAATFPKRGRSVIPVPPLEALRSYRALAGALARATGDLGYVAARALEQMAAGGW